MSLRLSRKPGESIVIQTEPPIVIEVVEVEGNKVGLRIDADPAIKILRSEVIEREHGTTTVSR